ncbi:YcbK family protein [Paraburkholderia sp. UCT31]|uniref:YcbK family protein n=1 Tax=Paraburkholderia sp. UCT31 TaxID=2615209 RepID=UPI00165543F2|nr:DUF882 domain-containing protein [Paraburkholderia sp. UCT31]MBC8737289.1 YcbK family protein [Paraburkholderia sp. UCT31]
MTDLILPPLETETDLKRRAFMKAGVALALMAGTPLSAVADENFWSRPRELKLYCANTREALQVVYWSDNQLNYPGYYQICQLLRDTHENKAVQMDVVLLDILRGVQGYYEAYGFQQPLVINSGFRTEKTNERLRKEGAVRNSMHLYGKAADIYMPGIPVKHLGAVGLYFRSGGVGFYEGKGFVHLDTGRLRTWRG